MLYSCFDSEILSGSCFSPVILPSLVSPVDCCFVICDSLLLLFISVFICSYLSKIPVLCFLFPVFQFGLACVQYSCSCPVSLVFLFGSFPPSVCLIWCIACLVILLCLALVWFSGIDIVFVLSPTTLLPCDLVLWYIWLPGFRPVWLWFLPHPY